MNKATGKISTAEIGAFLAKHTANTADEVRSMLQRKPSNVDGKMVQSIGTIKNSLTKKSSNIGGRIRKQYQKNSISKQMNQPNHRVKTYARRESRITAAQKKALAELLDLFELPFERKVINGLEFFPQAKRFALEIGFGDGEALVQRALQNPTTAYLGIEVYRPGVGKCLMQIKKNEIRNIRVSTADARDVVAHQLPSHSVDEFVFLFPDPWPKSRHQKRRLLNADFLELCTDRLTTSGTITVVTDCAGYAEQVDQIVTESARLENLEASISSVGNVKSEPHTRYARKAIQAGNQIIELFYVHAKHQST